MKIKNKERVCDCCGEVGHYGGKRKAENESNPKDGWFRLYWEKRIGQESWEDYQLKYEWEYKNGQRADGVSKGWHKDGQLKSIRTYKNGKMNGEWTDWYENGQKDYEGTFKDGEKEGLETHWYKNGKKWFEEYYKDGELIK